MTSHMFSLFKGPATIDQVIPLPPSPPGTTNIGAGRPSPRVVLGTTVKLFCPVTGINTPVTVWFRGSDGPVMVMEPRVTISSILLGGVNTVVLMIRNVSRDDLGLYECRTSNLAGRDVQTVTLQGVYACLHVWLCKTLHVSSFVYNCMIMTRSNYK